MILFFSIFTGTAYTGLHGRTLYPMACSTAARSGMRIISSRSFPTSLQFMCCQKLRRCVPAHLDVLEALTMPPGLKQYLANKMAWLVHALCPQAREPSSKEICTICQPLQSIFEGLTDYEESDEEDGRDLHLLLPSEDDSSDGEEDGRNCSSPIPCFLDRGAFKEYGEGTSSATDADQDFPTEYPFGFKRFKCGSGKFHVNLHFGKGEELPHEDTKEESDDSDSEMKDQHRLSRKRKR